MKFKVSGPAADGLKFYFRAGRGWPRGDSYQVVEVIDGESDDPSDKWRVCKATYESLAGDKNLRIVPDGDPAVLAEADVIISKLREQVAALESERDALRIKLAAAEQVMKRAQRPAAPVAK
jgi:hypothetical protein